MCCAPERWSLSDILRIHDDGRMAHIVPTCLLPFSFGLNKRHALQTWWNPNLGLRLHRSTWQQFHRSTSRSPLRLRSFRHGRCCTGQCLRACRFRHRWRHDQRPAAGHSCCFWYWLLHIHSFGQNWVMGHSVTNSSCQRRILSEHATLLGVFGLVGVGLSNNNVARK